MPDTTALLVMTLCYYQRNNNFKKDISPQGFLLLSFRTVNKEHYRTKIPIRNKYFGLQLQNLCNFLNSKFEKLEREQARQQHQQRKRKILCWTSSLPAIISSCGSSVTQSCPTLCDPKELQHTRLPCPSLAPKVCSNSYPLSQWCQPAISSSVVPYSSRLQYFPVFSNKSVLLIRWPKYWASVSTSVLLMDIQDWFPLRLTDLISLLSKGLSRVFSCITVQKHHFFGTQLSLWSNFHIHTWLLERP